MINFVDRLTRWLADLVARTMPPTGGFGGLTYAMAGVPNVQPLPIDHRAASDPVQDSGPAGETGLGGPQVQHFSADGYEAEAAAVNCTDPQYCWISGHPCACCGGSDTSCPPGTVAGSYWSYCCSGRTIFFRDCCGGTVTCPSDCPWCHNANEPNWCAGAGNNRYVCTQAADQGAC